MLDHATTLLGVMSQNFPYMRSRDQTKVIQGILCLSFSDLSNDSVGPLKPLLKKLAQKCMLIFGLDIPQDGDPYVIGLKT